MDKLDALLQDFDQALSQLHRALIQPEDEFIRDASIQRFEFCFELGWKCVQSLSKKEGLECPSPRMAFAAALRNGWSENEKDWLEILDARNKTSHTYQETTAREIFAMLPKFHDQLRKLCHKLILRWQEISAPPNT